MALSSALVLQQYCSGRAECSLPVPVLSITQQLLSNQKGSAFRKHDSDKNLLHHAAVTWGVVWLCDPAQHGLKHTQGWNPSALLKAAEFQFACFYKEKPTGMFSIPSVNGITLVTVRSGIVNDIPFPRCKAKHLTHPVFANTMTSYKGIDKRICSDFWKYDSRFLQIKQKMVKSGHPELSTAKYSIMTRIYDASLFFLRRFSLKYQIL